MLPQGKTDTLTTDFANCFVLQSTKTLTDSQTDLSIDLNDKILCSVILYNYTKKTERHGVGYGKLSLLNCFDI